MKVRVILYGALAGAIGGAVGWLPGELAAIPRPTEAALRYMLIALYFVVVGACIGAAIGSLDGVVNGVRSRAVQGGRMGALLGLAGGAVGSLPGEGTFEVLSAVNLGLVGRAIGWAIVGVFIGVSQGLITRDRARMVRGGLGGLLGGYLGGGFFEMVSLTMARGSGSRWIAVVILGAFLGAFIAFFQEWLAEAWLVVVSSGRQEGQKYNLTKGETVLGRGDRDDFILYAGEGVVPRHALIVRRETGHWIQAISPEHPISVDKQPVSGEQRLRHGSETALGGMALRYHEQTAKCPQCGKENPIRAKFCPGCGKQLVVK